MTGNYSSGQSCFTCKCISSNLYNLGCKKKHDKILIVNFCVMVNEKSPSNWLWIKNHASWQCFHLFICTSEKSEIFLICEGHQQPKLPVRRSYYLCGKFHILVSKSLQPYMLLYCMQGRIQKDAWDAEAPPSSKLEVALASFYSDIC